MAFNSTACYDMRCGKTTYPMISLPTMTKKDLATLIDAYADAKASRNQHLVNSMVTQLEQALDSLFPSDSGESEIKGSPEGEY